MKGGFNRFYAITHVAHLCVYLVLDCYLLYTETMWGTPSHIVGCTPTTAPTDSGLVSGECSHTPSHSHTLTIPPHSFTGQTIQEGFILMT